MKMQITLIILTASIFTTLTQVNLVYGANQNNSSASETSDKNQDVFALLKLERDVAKQEGSLEDLHSGKSSPFDLLGEVKDGGKFNPESGSFLPEYEDTK